MASRTGSTATTGIARGRPRHCQPRCSRREQQCAICCSTTFLSIAPLIPDLCPDAGSSNQTSNCKAASHRSKRKRYRQHDVAHGAPILAVAGQAEGLQAERRYGRVATQKSRHYEQPRIGRRKYRGVISSQGRKNADQEGAANIDGHGAPRERLAQAACHQTRQKVPRDAAQGAANRNTDQPAYHD